MILELEDVAVITIGLTTWTEHGSLMGADQSRKLTLPEYSEFLPCVELDTPFYGIPRQSSFAKWAQETPEQFQFIVKANQVMTRHRDYQETGAPSVEAVFQQFKDNSQPLVEAGKLKTILLQFPPYFGVSRENILYLQQVRQFLPDLPLAVEFRNKTWYEEIYLKRTLNLLRQFAYSHVIVDEPQTPAGSVPYYPVATNDDLAVFRLHGRNFSGWANQDRNWRSQRTLYRYRESELQALVPDIQRLAATTKEICVIFNNNSGGDAAGNALTLKKLLGLEFTGLNPQQIDLF
ncbi:DUF72 domain-containing protein [Loigolactobacillus backii]|uniref:DUF72 domain-containing protein n=1 Tax=Loigolactobacillus backii TaxID=375175 RepID=UPI001EFB86A2|nr:DUF72 domain-containing protein [Loigolactobacillus backii]MDA5388165.1 DUF72 domain-containing protein [Loigolactobacillus backii]